MDQEAPPPGACTAAAPLQCYPAGWSAERVEAILVHARGIPDRPDPAESASIRGSGAYGWSLPSRFGVRRFERAAERVISERATTRA